MTRTVRRGHVAALASAAKRGENADRNAADLEDTIREVEADGATTLRAIAEGLNHRKIGAARGGLWSAIQVSRVLARLGKME